MSESTVGPPAPDATAPSKTVVEENSLRSFSETLAGGELLASLEALRDEIAADLDVCDSMRDKAALYLRLVDVLARVEEARPIQSKGDAVDEIAARRAARRSGTSAYPSRAKHSG
jgi:hypothetical protein